MELNLVWLYPDILNLHGERGSIQAFQRISDNIGIKLNIIRNDNYKQEIDFENTDIIICPPGELKVIPNIKDALEEQIEELKKYVDEKKYLISIGTTGALLGKETVCVNGDRINGLGILNMTAIERNMVLGDDLYFTINKTKQEIIGSQIQMLDFKLNGELPLGTINYGYGNNGEKYEGARKENIIFTNCLGPLFVKNPWWTEAILKNAYLNKANKIISKNEYDIENKSFETTKRFIQEKPRWNNPRLAFEMQAKLNKILTEKNR